MELEYKYDSIDSVPEGYGALYEEVDGKAVLVGIKDLKTIEDTTTLQGSLNSERKDHKALKAKFKQLDGFDIDQVVADLDRIKELELQLEAASSNELTAEQIEASVEARLEARLSQHTAPLNRKLEEMTSERDEHLAAYKVSQEKIKIRDLHERVTKHALNAKVLPTALSDILEMSGRYFETNDDGEIFSTGAGGFTEGLPGKEAFEEALNIKKHWFPGSVGGGAIGGDANDVGVDNPWSKAGWNMTKQNEIRSVDEAKANRLAKSAGETK